MWHGIAVEYFYGNGSPLFSGDVKMPSPEHLKIWSKTPFLCHNFGQTLLKWPQANQWANFMFFNHVDGSPNYVVVFHIELYFYSH